MLYEQKKRELLSRLRREMNGAVVDDMRGRGAAWERTWGVSVASIRRIVREWGTDHDFAVRLYGEQQRELKIAAAGLADPARVSAGDAARWIAGAVNAEIAGIVASDLLARTTDARAIFGRSVRSGDPLETYIGLITGAKNLYYLAGRGWEGSRAETLELVAPLAGTDNALVGGALEAFLANMERFVGEN